MRKIASSFILGIMVMSVLGIYANNIQEDKSVSYNGYQFSPLGNGWQVRVNDVQYQFQHLPEELSDFPIGKISFGEKVYLAYDPTAKNISVQEVMTLVSNMVRQFGTRPVVACIHEDECPEEIPIISCDAAPAQVMVFRSAEEIGVLKNGQCTIIQAPTSGELHKAVERIMYQLVGIMKNE